jgi:DNA polymerase-3 subunit gamma/tau
MTQALYRKWRPRKWNEVVAQEHVVQTLRNAINAERVGHAYLFSGPRGTGKTTTARLLAKAVNCLSDDLSNRPCDECANCKAVNEGRFLDLIEIDAASNTSVEDVRDLRDRINYSPTDGRYKVYIIDEVHMLSTAAFNALLKTLEEPPPHAIFILATTEVHKIPATVLSRCQRHEFRRIPVAETVKTLRGICTEEGIEADDDALLLISRQSTGALRDAISLLDQLSSTGKSINLELAQNVLGTATNQLVFDLVDALVNNDPALGMVSIHKALDSGSDPRQYARQVVEYLRSLLLMQMGNEKAIEATRDVKTRMHAHSERIELNRLIEWVGLFNEAIGDLRTTWQPSLALEVAFARCLNPKSQPVNQSPETEIPANVSVTHKVDGPTAKPVEVEPRQPETELREKAKAAREPQPEPEPAEVEATGSEGSVTTQDVMAAWSRIRAEVKARRSQAEALLNSQRLVQVKGGTLVLGFQSETLKSKMENPENIEVTRRVIYNLLNADLPIQCIVVIGKDASGTGETSIEPDGLVNTAINLGGKLVHRD